LAWAWAGWRLARGRDVRNDPETVLVDASRSFQEVRGVEPMVGARRVSAAGHPSGAGPHPAEPGTGGTASPRAATGSRLAVRLAVAVGLLSVGLGVGALLLWPPFAGEERLPQQISAALLVIAGVPFSVMGALICARRPGNRVGWLLLITGSSSTWYQVATGYVAFGQDRERLLPASALVAWTASWAWAPALAAVLFLLLLYPTGRLLSRRWRPVAWAAGGWGVLTVVVMALSPELGPIPGHDNPIGVPGAVGDLLTRAAESGVVFWPFVALLMLSVAVLAVRFGRARGVERQQLKWLTYAASLAVVANFFWPAHWFTGGILPWLSVWAIPVAIGVAILRYRLYDIDRLINRTLVYGLLTTVLGVGFGGLVLVLGQLFGGVTRDPPSWAVAGATLAVAALFQPARRRIQQAVDRRFNRRKYDAAKTVEAFSARLRDELDLDTLTNELLTVVDQTMEPVRVSLWLRSAAASERTTR
jgi:hypothetical protein